MKKLLALVVLFSLGTGTVFSYFEEKVYCEVSGQFVQVYLGKGHDLKCMEYVRTLESVMNSLYQDLLTVEQYLNYEQDQDYRLSVQKDLKEKIQENNALRQSILRAMSLFEENLFVKLKEYILFHLQDYRNQIESELQQIEDADLELLPQDEDFVVNLVIRSIQLKEDFAFIERLEAVENMEELIVILPEFFEMWRRIGTK